MDIGLKPLVTCEYDNVIHAPLYREGVWKLLESTLFIIHIILKS